MTTRNPQRQRGRMTTAISLTTRERCFRRLRVAIVQRPLTDPVVSSSATISNAPETSGGMRFGEPVR